MIKTSKTDLQQVLIPDCHLYVAECEISHSKRDISDLLKLGSLEM